jgi:CRISPR-associated endonuclease Csn1
VNSFQIVPKYTKKFITMTNTKKILGLDIGVSSVGLAILSETNKTKKIEKLAVRIVPEDPDFHGKFYSGNTASKNLTRTEKRGSRRNNQRFKARRDHLYSVLKKNNMMPDQHLMKIPRSDLYELRAKAVHEKVSLSELGRIFILLNQRRGFLSNRKSNSEEENSSEYKERIAELESERGSDTIGQQLYAELKAEKPLSILLRNRTYLRASYLEEFDRIWAKQHSFHPSTLSGSPDGDDIRGTLYDVLRNQIIYFQRPLKSQKGLVSTCPFEVHHKAVHKSSPYFEQFRIWQKINDLSWNTLTQKGLKPTKEQKDQLYKALFHGLKPNKHKLTISDIKKILGFSRNERVYLSHEELDGSRTYPMLKSALKKADLDPEKHLHFDNTQNDPKGGLLELWHITYSSPTENELASTLNKRFGFTLEQGQIIAQNVSYKSEYGRLSTRAIKKLLPHLQKGLQHSDACDAVGYDHSGSKTKFVIEDKLKPIEKNSLRNPVVEQVLNQVVNMVNTAIDTHGPFDEIRVELARELRNSAKARNRISKNIAQGRKRNAEIRDCLKEDYGLKIVNGRDIKRYILWEETGRKCLYCSKKINQKDFLSGQAEIEHILPKSRSFSNAMSNYILAHRVCNDKKGQLTAFDFMKTKDEAVFNQYLETVNALFEMPKGGISRGKLSNLLCSGEEIPDDFVERMKKDSQYIATEAVKMLKTICEKTHTTTGQVTDLLREKWELKHLLQELSLPKYEQIEGMVGKKEIKNKGEKIVEVPNIEGWSKRDDHRHHTVDALITALTDQKIIFKLNNMNKLYLDKRGELSEEARNELMEKGFDIKEYADQAGYDFPLPMKELRQQAKEHLDGVFISFKKNSKVLSKSKDKFGQEYWIPRGPLHEETVMGRVKRQVEVKLNEKFSNIDNITNPTLKEMVAIHFSKHEGDPKKAFSKKTLKNEPILYKGKEVDIVPVWEKVGSKRVKLDENFSAKQRENIIDGQVKELLENYVEAFGNHNKAMKSLAEHPIWFNEAQGIAIKSVKVYDKSKVIAIHDKLDSEGKKVEVNGVSIPNDFVKTGSNHHALIFLDENDNYKERLVSFWDAVKLGMMNVSEKGSPFPIINRNDDPDLGTFHFSLQINDLFVFDLKHLERPHEENELNFYESKNRKLISDKLFRLQKMTLKGSGQFVVTFRHHLETQVLRKDRDGKSIDEKGLKEVAWIEIASRKDLKRLTKIRVNHLGDIVKVGE